MVASDRVSKCLLFRLGACRNRGGEGGKTVSEDSPCSLALEGASGKTGKGQLPNREVKVKSIRAIELMGRCGRMLFWFGFLRSESILVNSQEKSADFEQKYTVFGSQSPSALHCWRMEEYPGKAPL